MRVTEGTSFELSDGSWQKPEIELGDEDFDRAMAEWGVDSDRVASLPLTARYSLMSALARLMLVERQLSAKKLDERWLKEEGGPMRESVVTELQGLYKLVTGKQ